MSSLIFSLHENNKSIASDLLAVLQDVNDDFYPPLNSWVNLEAYADKMADKAICWLAHNGAEPIAFAACYVNQAPAMSFWTMLAIKKNYRNQMIALLWESQIIRYCKEKGSAGILAEVDSRNSDLIALHRRFGFMEEPLRMMPDGREIIPLTLIF